MKDKYNLPLLTTVAVLSYAVSGCGDSDTQKTSSTNDTEQRVAERYNDTRYKAEFFNDGGNLSSKDIFRIPTGDRSSNTRPIADISGTHTYLSGETVVLDGSGSYDEEGDDLRFFWTQVNGPRIELEESYGDSLTFVAPEVSKPTKLNFFLVVYDGMYVDLTGFSLQVSPVMDNTTPSVTGRFPQPNQNNVPTNAEISVTFDEALSENHVDANSLIVTHSGSLVPGNVSYDDVSHSIIFLPNSALDGNTQYTVTLGDAIQDIAGNLLSPESWEFTTVASDDTDGGSDDKPNDGGDDNTEGGSEDKPNDGGGDNTEGGSEDKPNDGGSGDNPGNPTPYNLGSTTEQTIKTCMDEADKQMLSLVNNARAQTRSCGTMSYQAAPALSWNCQLENAAHGHSLSMAENNYFDHTGIDGSSPGDRISAAGYAWKAYGENIAAGYTDAESVMQGWLTSPGHCANLMNTSFKEVGVGVVKGGSGSYGTYWTQTFAAQ
jgi:uncharacterized protein YkwD